METLVQAVVAISAVVIGVLAVVYVQEHSPLQRLSEYLDIQDRDQYQMLVLAIALIFFGLVFGLLSIVEWVL